MRALAWNCQGVGSPLIIHQLKELSKLYSPGFFFLSETKNSEKKLRNIQQNLHMDQSCIVDPMGTAGGLALFWQNEIQLSVIYTTNFFIEAQVVYVLSKHSWRLICMYFSSVDSVWVSQMHYIQERSASFGQHWVIWGDFNDILHATKKRGGHARPHWSLIPFRSFIDSSGLLDLGYSGFPFTWRNNRNAGSYIIERLDRVLASVDWQLSFDRAIVTHWSRTFKVVHKLSQCRANLRIWSTTRNFNSAREIRHLKDQLVLKRQSLRPNQAHIHSLEHNLQTAWGKEEAFWRQKSRIDWLRLSDKNSKFFHVCTMQRRSRNRISGVESVSGDWISDMDRVAFEFNSFFQQLYSPDSSFSPKPTLGLFPCIVNASMNSQLTGSVSNAEIRATLFDMSPSKAPGIDGLTAGFYQAYWDVMLRSINHTLISLIPKVPHPVKVSQYRPISLCIVLYKIISKILAKRLAPLLPSLVSENQSGFVTGRQITDNILVAHEVMHYIKQRRQGQLGLILDMTKAYDRVSWSYLEAIMLKMGFNPRWVSWIMECVLTVSFSILLNGEHGAAFNPKRGLSQGCQLSPMLFILCAEGFHLLFQQTEAQRQLHGVRIGRSCPPISHLLFADNSIIFCQASVANGISVWNLLNIYETASRQTINRDKSKVFFSPNTPVDRRSFILQSLGIALVAGGGKYLGLPSIIGRSKMEVFHFIQVRVLSRIARWKESFLSQAGREVLLNSVLMAMPNYAMSCFKLSVSLSKKINAAIARFWWGSQGDERKVHWLSWPKLSACKKRGGLGFRDLEAMNLALLAKQGWRLVSGPPSLFQRVFKAKYFHNTSFWVAKDFASASWALKSILACHKVLERGWRWQVGNGRNIRIWDDPWLPSQSTFRVLVPRPADAHITLVCDLIDSVSMTWNQPLLLHSFSENMARMIMAIPLSYTGVEDKRIWYFPSTGNFTVRSAYDIASQRKVLTDPWCPRCGVELETLDHLMLRCPNSQLVWKCSPLRLEWPSHITLDCFSKWWHYLEHHLASVEQGDKILHLACCICWALWKSRNAWVFSKIHQMPPFISSLAVAEWIEFSDVLDLDSHEQTSSLPSVFTAALSLTFLLLTVGCVLLLVISN
ncbi:uncharacterized protein LOC114296911 [Camellia sinensis]|uniref:uncharacterized protein LOC114296911 n=1 Tax=Camellia sinensis TaxID=4442 RepID=UPI0010367811|nr:uncharacterized protein LOC114296911 [Camellia sinensis]